MAVTLRVRNLSKPGSCDEHIFREDTVTIGRDASNVLVLADPDKVISRKHAAIHCGALPYLVDLGSHNATFLNGRQVHPGKPQSLKAGDAIRVGPFTIEFFPGPVEELLAIAPMVPAPGTLVRQGAEHTAVGAATGEGHSEGNSDTADYEHVLHRAVRELRILNDLAVEVGASHDTQAIVQRIVQRSVQAVDAEQGAITLAGDEAADHGKTMIRSMEQAGEAFHANHFLLAWMQEYMRPLLLNNPREDTTFGPAGWTPGIRSILAVPLMVRSRMLGVLTLYNKRDPDGFTAEDERLLSIIAAQSAQVIENARLFEEEKRYLKMQQELNVALDIQTNLLPRRVPEVLGYDIAGKSIPASTVGGDYFDYVRVDEQRLAVCVGDVSGKGLPAAMVMANLQATLRAQAYWSSSVAQCLEGANDLLFQSTNKRTFITLFYGVLDPQQHTFRYANAGHNKPLLYRPGSTPAELELGSLALGLRSGISYPEGEHVFAPGDTLLIYSDGVTEAMSAAREQFGIERLMGVLQQYGQESGGMLMQRVLQAVQAHAAGAPQADDITVLVVRRLQ